MSCCGCGVTLDLSEDGSAMNSCGSNTYCDSCFASRDDRPVQLSTEPLSVTATADASKFPPMAGWYPSPAGEPIPWHFDGNRWSHPAERFDTMIEALFSDEDMTALMRKMVVEKRPMVQRKIFYAKVKFFFRDLTSNVKGVRY